MLRNQRNEDLQHQISRFNFWMCYSHYWLFDNARNWLLCSSNRNMFSGKSRGWTAYFDCGWIGWVYNLRVNIILNNFSNQNSTSSEYGLISKSQSSISSLVLKCDSESQWITEDLEGNPIAQPLTLQCAHMKWIYSLTLAKFSKKNLFVYLVNPEINKNGQIPNLWIYLAF